MRDPHQAPLLHPPRAGEQEVLDGLNQVAVAVTQRGIAAVDLVEVAIELVNTCA